MTSIWREVGDRVWVRRYAWLDQTIGVIGGEDGLVVIDTRATHPLADELRADMRALGPSPLAAVVNTHGHWDHAFGNARFLPAPIWGHVRCATMILERGEEMRARMIEEFPDEAFDTVELTPPTELFEEAATLDLGDRQVELRYLGRGHTDNDIVITVPDASVLFAGDLLENAPAPAFGDSYPIAWVETGRALLALVDGRRGAGSRRPVRPSLRQRPGRAAGGARGARPGGGRRRHRPRTRQSVGRRFRPERPRSALERVRLELQ